jgi:acyl carrier protein
MELNNMELNDFIAKFANLFEETDPSSITADTVYSEIEEWDSVMVLLLVSMIDEEYGVIVDVEEMSETETVKDLFEYVKSLR